MPLKGVGGAACGENKSHEDDTCEDAVTEDSVSSSSDSIITVREGRDNGGVRAGCAVVLAGVEDALRLGLVYTGVLGRWPAEVDDALGDKTFEMPGSAWARDDADRRLFAGEGVGVTGAVRALTLGSPE